MVFSWINNRYNLLAPNPGKSKIGVLFNNKFNMIKLINIIIYYKRKYKYYLL